MKKKITLIIAVLTLGIATLTGCGNSEDLKSTIEKMDTVEINDLVEKNKDKTEDEIKKVLDDKNQSEDKKEDSKEDEKKDDDKKSETAEKKEDTKSDDKKADTDKTDNKTASNDTKKDTPKSESPKQESKPSGNKNTNTSTGSNKTEAPKGCSHDWKPNYKTVTVKAAYDEQVKVRDAWDETVTVKDAWTENVLVTAAWDEVVNDVIVDQYDVCTCGAILRTQAESQQHALEKLMNPDRATCGSYTNKVIYGSRTIHHEAVYQTVNHPAETKTVHHEAEYKTVHHDAQTKQEIAGYTCNKCGAKK